MSAHTNFKIFSALVHLDLKKTHTVAQRKRFISQTLKDVDYSARQLLDLLRGEIKAVKKDRALTARVKARRVEVLEQALFNARRCYNATIGRAA